VDNKNPPNGRVLPFALDGLCEPSLFRQGLGAIYALGANQDDYHPERDPLLFVHGLEGSPADLQAVVDRFRGSRYQLYALAYTQDVLAQLPARLVDYYAQETPVRGDPRLVNDWLAMISAEAYWDFHDQMTQLADAQQLDAKSALAALEQHYPRFPGDHVGVIREHAGQFSFIDYLKQRLP
jgi:hypothetical protein